MKPLHRLPLKLVYHAFGTGLFNQDFFDNRLVQKMAGFTRGKGAYVSDRASGLAIEYPFTNDLGLCLFLTGSFERREVDFFLRKLVNEKQPVVLDIGANIGWHSLKWAQACSDIHIYAFEPSPDVYPVLKDNIHRNGLGDRVTTIPEALSDYRGEAQFFQCEDNAFSSLKDTQRKAVVSTVMVPVNTIDAFVAARNIDRLTFIKIDVEGFETEVLAGGLQTLKRFKPDLFVEIYAGNNSNLDPEKTIQLLRSVGYNAFVLVKGQPVPYESHSDRYYNYYFTQKDHP